MPRLDVGQLTDDNNECGLVSLKLQVFRSEIEINLRVGGRTPD